MNKQHVTSLELSKRLKEEWVPVIGYEGLYEVSNMGQVKSLRRSGAVGGLLKPFTMRSSYHHVRLSKKNKFQSYTVHKLVALHFIGKPRKGQQINHKDGNKVNNIFTNLEWCTQKQNIKHSIEVLGYTGIGHKNYNFGYKKARFYPSNETRKRLFKLGIPYGKHDVVSLTEMLPKTIKTNNKRYSLMIFFPTNIGMEKSVRVCYQEGDWDHGVEEESALLWTEDKETMPEAMGLMLAWLKQEKLI